MSEQTRDVHLFGDERPFCVCGSDRKRSGSNQVSQSSPLIGIQNGMDLLQGLENGLPQPGLALNAELTSFTGLGRVESVSGQGVGEGRHRSAPVDFRLSALGLQLIENAS